MSRFPRADDRFVHVRESCDLSDIMPVRVMSDNTLFFFLSSKCDLVLICTLTDNLALVNVIRPTGFYMSRSSRGVHTMSSDFEVGEVWCSAESV